MQYNTVRPSSKSPTRSVSEDTALPGWTPQTSPDTGRELQKRASSQSGFSTSAPQSGESAAFFDQWTIYRKIIEYNYMGHDEIAETMRRMVSERRETQSILDLGCGDAELPSRYLPGLGVIEYHGVDLAEKPLEFAGENLAGLPGAVHLHLRDQAEFIAETDRTFDVIVLGFALHHNPLEEKAELMANARQRMNREGDLFVYDVFCKPDETRESFFERYLEWIERNWTEMTSKEHTLINDHIRTNDHPDSISALRECGLQAGLSSAEVRLSTCAGFHHLLHFQSSSSS